MKTLSIVIIYLIIFAASTDGQSRWSLTGGYELGFMNSGRIGKGYEQNIKSTRYIGDVAWRYNGANHLVLEGGYRYDSCAFVNNVEYLMPDESAFFSYNTNGMLKMNSALLGLAYRLALNGETFGVMIQTGATGQYMYQASRYRLPDEHFEYRLYDEINPFNVLWRTKIGLRLSVFQINIGYERPFYNTINHNEVIKPLPDEKNPSAALRGIRLDSEVLYVSIGMKVTLGQAYKIFNNAAKGKKGRELIDFE